MRTPCPRGCMSHPPPSHALGGANRKLRMKRLKGKKRLKRQHQKAEEAKCVRLPSSWMTVGSDQAHDWAALAFRSGLSRQAIARGTSTATRSAQGPLPAGVPPVAETAAEGDRREEGEAQRAPEVCCAGLESPSLETLPHYTPPQLLVLPCMLPPGWGGGCCLAGPRHRIGSGGGACGQKHLDIQPRQLFTKTQERATFFRLFRLSLAMCATCDDPPPQGVGVSPG